MTDLSARQARARQWFEELQTQIIAAMEELEATCPGFWPLNNTAAQAGAPSMMGYVDQVGHVARKN